MILSIGNWSPKFNLGDRVGRGVIVAVRADWEKQEAYYHVYDEHTHERVWMKEEEL